MTTVPKIAERINASSDINGLVPISAKDVELAIASLKKDGYSMDYLVDREELIARRIVRLDDPGKFAR